METAEQMASAFEAEANIAPVVNVSGVDAPIATAETIASKFYTEDDLAKVRSQEKEKLYPQIDKLKEEVEALKKDKAEKTARREAEEGERVQRDRYRTRNRYHFRADGARQLEGLGHGQGSSD